MTETTMTRTSGKHEWTLTRCENDGREGFGYFLERADGRLYGSLDLASATGRFEDENGCDRKVPQSIIVWAETIAESDPEY